MLPSPLPLGRVYQLCLNVPWHPCFSIQCIWPLPLDLECLPLRIPSVPLPLRIPSIPLPLPPLPNCIVSLSPALLSSNISPASKPTCSSDPSDPRTHPSRTFHVHIYSYLFPPLISTILLLSTLIHLSFHSLQHNCCSDVCCCYSTCYVCCSYSFSCFSFWCCPIMKSVVIVGGITCECEIVVVESSEEWRGGWRSVQWIVQCVSSAIWPRIV